MQTKILTSILLFFLYAFTFAGKIDRAFASLKELNYFDAKQCFEQEVKKKNSSRFLWISNHILSR